MSAIAPFVRSRRRGEKNMPRNVAMMRNPGIARAVIFVVVVMLTQSLAGQIGTTYYVSKKGSDGNPGTLGAPWLTIQHAANAVSAGATVYVFGGIYNEAVNFPSSGTASAPITFQSYPGQTVVIDGTGLKGRGTQGLITSVGRRRYLPISGFELRRYTTSSENDVPAGVWITGS